MKTDDMSLTRMQKRFVSILELSGEEDQLSFSQIKKKKVYFYYTYLLGQGANARKIVEVTSLTRNPGN